METPQVVQKLCDALTPRLVAGLAGVQEPTQQTQRRLRFAYDVLHEIEGARGVKVAQAWFLSINPRLGHDSPLKAVREDRFQETAAAAKALLEDAYDG